MTDNEVARLHEQNATVFKRLDAIDRNLATGAKERQTMMKELAVVRSELTAIIEQSKEERTERREVLGAIAGINASNRTSQHWFTGTLAVIGVIVTAIGVVVAIQL